MKRSRTADGYIRVSRRAGREGESFISPEVQRKKIAGWAKLHEVEIVKWWEEIDQSGAKLERPMFQQALARCEAGETGGIVVARLDRFARSAVDALSSSGFLQTARSTATTGAWPSPTSAAAAVGAAAPQCPRRVDTATAPVSTTTALPSRRPRWGPALAWLALETAASRRILPAATPAPEWRAVCRRSPTSALRRLRSARSCQRDAAFDQVVAARRRKRAAGNLELHWRAHLDGIYGVCLREVTPEKIAGKAKLVSSISELLTLARPADPNRRVQLRDEVEELDELERERTPDYVRNKERFGRKPTRDLLIGAARERYPDIVGACVSRSARSRP
jgi:hypothetical protein